MSIAVPAVPALLPAATAASAQLVRVEIFDTFAAAAPHWLALEGDGAVMTPYQRYAFLEAWQRHVGASEKVVPLIAVGLNGAGAPLTLWPLGRRQFGAVTIAEYLGGKHANYNFALWRRDAAASANFADLAAMRAKLAQHVDTLALTNQPERWHGVSNPLLNWPHQFSPGFGYCGTLAGSFEEVMQRRTSSDMRRKMRKKAERLATHGAIHFSQAHGEHEISRVLAAFFAQKGVRLKMQGHADVFAEPAVQRFITAASHTGAIELYSLSVGDEIVATVGGLAGGDRFCTMFSSIAQGRYSGESPGEQAMIGTVRAVTERGLSVFDLGVGEARYKGTFCPDHEPLFDNYIGLSARGRIVAALMREQAGIKRILKQNPLAWALIEKLRRFRAQLA